MVLGSNVPSFALEPYRTGKVTVLVARNQGGGTPDTIALPRATLIQMQPSRLRHSTIAQALAFRPGRTFSVRTMHVWEFSMPSTSK